MATLEDNLMLMTAALIELAPKLAPFPYSRQINVDSVSSSYPDVSSDDFASMIENRVSSIKKCSYCSCASSDLTAQFKFNQNIAKARIEISEITASCPACSEILNLSDLVRDASMSVVDDGEFTSRTSSRLEHFMKVNSLDVSKGSNFHQAINVAANMSVLSRDIRWKITVPEAVAMNLIMGGEGITASAEAAAEEIDSKPSKSKKKGGK